MSKSAAINRNAAFNVAGGLSTMLLSIALPPILSRTLNAYDMSIWMLSLQVANYLMILNLGLQIVVARLVAEAEAVGDIDKRNAIVSTAFFMLAVIAALGFLTLLYIIRNFAWIDSPGSDGAPGALNATISWIAASFMAWLPASLLLATFIGQQRNQWYAAAMFFSRMAILTAVAAVAYQYGDVTQMAKAWFFATLVGSLAIIALYYLKVRFPQISVRLFVKTHFVDLIRNSLTIGFWNLLVLAVTGGQVLILSMYDINSVAIFASALALSTVMTGITGAFSTTIVPVVAAHVSNGEGIPHEEFYRISLMSNIIMFGGSSTIVIGGWWLTRIWLGEYYSDIGSTVLGLVAISQALRTCLATYSMVVIALGLQNKLLIGPLGEGVAALAISYYLSPIHGLNGVIAAMLLAPVINIAFTIAVNPIKSIDGGFSILSFVKRTIIPPTIPLLASIALVAATGIEYLRDPSAGVLALFVGAGYAYWAARIFFRMGARKIASTSA